MVRVVVTSLMPITDVGLLLKVLFGVNNVVVIWGDLDNVEVDSGPEGQNTITLKIN